MYNINMYSYTGIPYSRERTFTIHPLNDPGFKTYTGPDSHNVNYVSQINPKVFKQIVGVDYDTLISQQQHIIQNKHNNSSMIQPVQPVKEHQPQTTTVINECKPPKSKINVVLANTHEQQSSPTLLRNRTLRTYRNNSANDIFNNSNQYFHKKKTFKEMYGYDNISKHQTAKEKYMFQLNQLKQRAINDNNDNNSHSNVHYKHKRYKGFTPYMIPRTDGSTPSTPHAAFDAYNKTLQRSLSCCTINNTHNTSNTTNIDKLRSSNDKIKTYLQNQTSRSFLSRNKLPDITKIALTRQIIRKVNNGNHKLLSEKYNPCALILPSKNRYAVNYYGALFQH